MFSIDKYYKRKRRVNPLRYGIPSFVLFQLLASIIGLWLCWSIILEFKRTKQPQSCTYSIALLLSCEGEETNSSCQVVVGRGNKLTRLPTDIFTHMYTCTHRCIHTHMHALRHTQWAFTYFNLRNLLTKHWSASSYIFVEMAT